MTVTLIRAIVLYAAVIFLIRLMGKRQIGEMQPSELVITFLISEIASIPMQDNTVPLINSVIALFVLVALEIFISAIGLKSHSLGILMQGRPVIVIRDGEIDMKALGKLRITVSDLVSALRQKDIFELKQISYAIYETNGKLSVLLKPEYRNVSINDMGITPESNGMPFPVICDGKTAKYALQELGKSEGDILSVLEKEKTNKEDVALMTMNNAMQAEIFKTKKED